MARMKQWEHDRCPWRMYCQNASLVVSNRNNTCRSTCVKSRRLYVLVYLSLLRLFFNASVSDLIVTCFQVFLFKFSKCWRTYITLQLYRNGVGRDCGPLLFTFLKCLFRSRQSFHRRSLILNTLTSHFLGHP